jgi:hypothetical protein
MSGTSIAILHRSYHHELSEPGGAKGRDDNPPSRERPFSIPCVQSFLDQDERAFGGRVQLSLPAFSWFTSHRL